MRMRQLSPEARAGLMAAEWAAQFKMPIGNHWEPAMVRHILREYHNLGSDANAWAFTEAKLRIQLGLEPPR